MASNMDDFYRSLGVVNNAAEGARAQQNIELGKKRQLADFLEKGINPDASGLNELGQSNQNTAIKTNVFTQEGMDPNSERSTGLQKTMQSINKPFNPGATFYGVATSDLEKMQPTVDTGIKAGAGIQTAEIAADARAKAAKLKENTPNPMVEFRKKKQVEDKTESLSKREEKLNSFNSALEDVEALTNRDGKGGVISNPTAKLISAGKTLSSVPTSAIGVGELMGAYPKGTADERKALERLKIEYQQAKSGMRVTKDARDQEAAAMGWISSGDPDLVAKGIRALARVVRNQHRTIQAGYEPEVVEKFSSKHGNPLDAYSHLQDQEAGPTVQSRKRHTVSAPEPAMGQPSSEEQEYLMLRKKHKGF